MSRNRSRKVAVEKIAERASIRESVGLVRLTEAPTWHVELLAKLARKIDTQAKTPHGRGAAYLSSPRARMRYSTMSRLRV